MIWQHTNANDTPTDACDSTYYIHHAVTNELKHWHGDEGLETVRTEQRNLALEVIVKGIDPKGLWFAVLLFIKPSAVRETKPLLMLSPQWHLSLTHSIELLFHFT